VAAIRPILSPLCHYVVFIERKEVSIMNNYIKYTFYDDDKRLIAIVNKNIPKEVMQELLQKYDEVKFEE